MAERPSFLQVDRWHVAGDPRARTLAGEPEWSDHLAGLVVEDALPAWVRALDRPARRRRWWIAPSLVVVAAVALVLAQRPYVGIKGDPTLIVHVHTSAGSEVWDGREPLRAGDRIRLEVRGVPTDWFAVVYVPPDEPPVVLATDDTAGLLESAWAFDRDAAGGRLVVIGATVDPAGVSASELLAQPALVAVQLR